jgi:hypothetical protein
MNSMFFLRQVRRPNNSFNPTGVSVSFIEKLDVFGVVVRRVNSGVGRLMVEPLACWKRRDCVVRE